VAEGKAAQEAAENTHSSEWLWRAYPLTRQAGRYSSPLGGVYYSHLKSIEPMDISKILTQLRQEREQIEEAVMSLERLARGSSRSRGRQPLWSVKKGSDDPDDGSGGTSGEGCATVSLLPRRQSAVVKFPATKLKP
jgi:hypothetical protein